MRQQGLLREQLQSLVDQHGWFDVQDTLDDLGESRFVPMSGMELMLHEARHSILKAAVDYARNTVLPYPFCRHPEDCAGRGYCRHDPACND